MTPEERITALEVEVKHLKDDVKEANDKLDKLVAAANMAGGAFWAALKIGGTLVVVISGAVWVISNVFKIKWG